MADLSRRSLLCSGIAFGLSVPVASLFNAQGAFAEPTSMFIIASTKAAVGVAGQLGLFGDTTGGDALRMDSLNIRLDRVLRNQNVLLDASVVLFDEIQRLSEHLGEEFRLGRLAALFDDVDTLHDELMRQLNAAEKDAGVFSSTARYDRFLDTRAWLARAIRIFGNRVKEFSVPQSGDKNSLQLPRAIKAGFAAAKILESLKVFTYLESKFDASLSRGSWSPVQEITESRGRLAETMAAFVSDFLVPARTREVEVASDHRVKIGKNYFGPVIAHLEGLAPSATINDASRIGDRLPAREVQILAENGGIGGGPGGSNCSGLHDHDLKEGARQYLTLNLVLKRLNISAVTAKLTDSAPASDTLLAFEWADIQTGSGKKTTVVNCLGNVLSRERVINPREIESGVIHTFYVGTAYGQTFTGNLEAAGKDLSLLLSHHATAQAQTASYRYLIQAANGYIRELEIFRDRILPHLAARR